MQRHSSLKRVLALVQSVFGFLPSKPESNSLLIPCSSVSNSRSRKQSLRFQPAELILSTRSCICRMNSLKKVLQAVSNSETGNANSPLGASQICSPPLVLGSHRKKIRSSTRQT